MFEAEAPMYRILFALVLSCFTLPGLAVAGDAVTVDFDGRCAVAIDGTRAACRPVMTTMADASLVLHTIYGATISLSFGGSPGAAMVTANRQVVPVHVVGRKTDGKLVTARAVGSCVTTIADKRVRSVSCDARDETGEHSTFEFLVD